MQDAGPKYINVGGPLSDTVSISTRFDKDSVMKLFLVLAAFVAFVESKPAANFESDKASQQSYPAQNTWTNPASGNNYNNYNNPANEYIPPQNPSNNYQNDNNYANPSSWQETWQNPQQNLQNPGNSWQNQPNPVNQVQNNWGDYQNWNQGSGVQSDPPQQTWTPPKNPSTGSTAQPTQPQQTWTPPAKPPQNQQTWTPTPKPPQNQNTWGQNQNNWNQNQNWNQPTTVPTTQSSIIKNEQSFGENGNYKYEYQIVDGTHVGEEGYILNPNSENESIVKKGWYSYPGPDGKTYTVTYWADETGFHAFGDHLPKAPAVPPAIQAAIDAEKNKPSQDYYPQQPQKPSKPQKPLTQPTQRPPQQTYYPQQPQQTYYPQKPIAQPPQQNYPQQNYPQQNYPQQNYPQQNYPQQNYPQQNYPQQPSNNQQSYYPGK